MSETRDCDVLIVGGGLVGAALAHALATLRLTTVLVEAHAPRVREQPGFDSRVTALANGSQRILAGLELWPALEPAAEPITSIHVSEQTRFGAVRIDAAEEGVAALGYTVENHILGRALWDGLTGRARAASLAPATLESLVVDGDAAVARVASADGPIAVRGKLLVAADGARSRVREALGIAARRHDYGQHAVVVNCMTEAAPRGRAFERFTRGGPLAFLPLTSERCGVIWTLPAETASRVMALDEAAFGAELQTAFGHRLGRITRVGARSVHALTRVRSTSLRGPRVVFVGNAALTLHPVAGQGFNLALRDVAALAEVVAEELAARGAGADPGADAVLERYEAWRVADQRKVEWFTHALVQLFARATPGVGLARGLALAAFDIAPCAKTTLARHTMGRAGRLPRLACGIGLGE